MTGEFSVYQYFVTGDGEAVLTDVDAKTAVYTAKSLTESAGGRLGITTKVIITDGEDYTAFHWEFGKGVLFPPLPPPAP